MGFAFLLFYLVLTYVRPAELIPSLAEYRVMLVVGPVALLASLIGLLVRPRPPLRSPQIALLAVFGLWIGVTVAAQGWIGGALEAWSDMLPTFILFALIVLNVDSVSRLATTAALLVVLTFLAVGQGVLAYHFGIGEETFVVTDSPDADADEGALHEADPSGEGFEPDAPPPGVRRIRALGYLHDPNDLAQGILAVLPLVFVRWRPRQKTWNLLAVILPAAALLYGLYLTKSRGGLLSTFALAAFVLQERVGRGWGTALVGASSTFLVGASIGGRSLSLDSSTLGRLLAWREGLEMMRRSPVYGVGFGNFTEHNELVAHNSFVHCFAELGLVGYGLWLGALTVTWGQLAFLVRHEVAPGEVDALAPWAAAIRRGLVGFLFAALFLSRSYSVVLFLIFGLATAVCEMARQRDEAVSDVGPWVWLRRVLVLEVSSVVLVYAAVSVLL